MEPKNQSIHDGIKFNQTVAILIDGNNIEIGLANMFKKGTMLNFNTFVPNVLRGRMLGRISYFREGTSISQKLSERLDNLFFGTTIPCYKSADVPLTIEAVQLCDKVDTVVIGSGDADYIALVKYLKARGLRVEIAAVKNTISAELTKYVDGIHCIDKDDIFNVYGHGPVKKKPYHKEGFIVRGSRTAPVPPDSIMHEETNRLIISSIHDNVSDVVRDNKNLQNPDLQ